MGVTSLPRPSGGDAPAPGVEGAGTDPVKRRLVICRPSLAPAYPAGPISPAQRERASDSFLPRPSGGDAPAPGAEGGRH
jgi:hypothetical protein